MQTSGRLQHPPEIYSHPTSSPVIQEYVIYKHVQDKGESLKQVIIAGIVKVDDPGQTTA